MDDVHLSGAAILVIGTLLGSLAAVVSMLFKLLLKSKDDQYTDIKVERDNYRQMATEAINLLEEVTSQSRRTVPITNNEEKETNNLKDRLNDLTKQLEPPSK
jgi:hypothetical protein